MTVQAYGREPGVHFETHQCQLPCVASRTGADPEYWISSGGVISPFSDPERFLNVQVWYSPDPVSVNPVNMNIECSLAHSTELDAL